MFEFNDLLQRSGVDPNRTAICLHKPTQLALRRLLPFFVVSEPELFVAYQSSHNSQATATLRNREFMASFVWTDADLYCFAGLFRVSGVSERPVEQIRNKPEIGRLMQDFGVYLELANPEPPCCVWFDLEETSVLRELIGRISISPPVGRTYMRLAENFAPECVEVLRENQLAPSAPAWREFIVTGPEMRTLPESWKTRLREWRGIYLILDESDGARYVGAAYGEANLLGRWEEHVRRDRGITVELRRRDPSQFRFSILERVSPDLPAEDVIGLERTWMRRLHTVEFGLNK